jgi:hypothetical protein
MNSPSFNMTVRYGIGHPDPIRQYHGNEQRIKKLLDEVDFTHVIRIEIAMHHG